MINFGEMSKKLATKLIAAFLLAIVSIFLSAPQETLAQQCFANNTSCDNTAPCCDFPDYVCDQGYCQPPAATCGKAYTPCCDSPNPQCADGLTCQNNACIPETPPPTCGEHGQACCPGNECNVAGEACFGGICNPCGSTGQCGGPGQPCDTSSGSPSCQTGYICNPADNTCVIDNQNFSQCQAAGGTCETETTCPTGKIADSKLAGCQTGTICCVADPNYTRPHGGNIKYLFCDPEEQTEINTAIGCIPISDTNRLVGFFLRFAIGIGGGIAFLLILYSGFQIITSGGDPERVKGARQLLTAAISGLLILVLSVFILEILGVDILKLPGLVN